MHPLKLVAVLIIAGGVFGLSYGGFNFTRHSDTTEIGPLTVTVKDREHVNVPVWAGVAAIVGGVVLLFAAGGKSGVLRGS